MLDASPLEVAVLRAFHELYGACGFPTPHAIHVRGRDDTGSGRFVDLHAEVELELDDGYLDLGGQFIEMRGIQNGLMAVILIKDHRLDHLEIAVYGDDAWDGKEREWSIA